MVGPIRSRNFYDDITSRISCKGGELADTLAEHGQRLADNLTKARLKYSKKKTTVVASSPALAKAVSQRLAELGLEIMSSRATRDLGLDAAGGSKRATKVQRGRMDKATSKLKKSRGLVKTNVSAARIIRTGAEPTWKYGVEAYGLTNSSLAKLRSATSCAAAVGGRSRTRSVWPPERPSSGGSGFGTRSLRCGPSSRGRGTLRTRR